MAIKQAYRPIAPVNIGVNKDTVNDFARKYNLEIEQVYDILNKYKQRKVVFKADGDYWNVEEGKATLTTTHNGNIVYGVYRTADGVDTKVLVGISMDNTNVILEAEAPFDGYMLMLSDDSSKGVGNNLPDDVVDIMDEYAAIASEAAAVAVEAKDRVEYLVDGHYPYVTPEMFGAVGDGVADDTDAFQSAIETQMPIYIPKGDYLLLGTLEADNIEMQGRKKVRLICKSQYLFNTYTNVHLKNISFDFDNVGYGLFKQNAFNAEEIVLKSCKIKNTSSTSTNYIAQTSAAWCFADNVNISKCKFKNLKGHGIQLRSDNLHSTVIIDSCKIDNEGIVPIGPITSAFGIGSYQSAAKSGNYDSVIVTNCTIKGCLGSGCAMHSMDNVVVKGNTFKNNGEHAIVFQDGINAIIAENICDTQPGCGVRVQTNSRIGDTGHVIIANNNIIGNGVLLGGKTVFDVIVNGNIITEGEQHNYGISLTGVYNNTKTVSFGITITNNRVNGNYDYNYDMGNLPNYNFDACDNYYNDEKVYGMHYLHNKLLMCNACRGDKYGASNVLKDEQITLDAVTVNGNEYTINEGLNYRIFARIVLTNDDVDFLKLKWLGVKLKYSSNTPLTIGYSAATTNESQLYYYAVRCPVLDMASQGEIEIIIPFYDIFKDYLPNMASLRVSVEKSPDAVTRVATIDKFKVYKGNGACVN